VQTESSSGDASVVTIVPRLLMSVRCTECQAQLAPVVEAGRLAIGFTADFTTHHAPDRIRFARIWWLLATASGDASVVTIVPRLLMSVRCTECQAQLAPVVEVVLKGRGAGGQDWTRHHAGELDVNGMALLSERDFWSSEVVDVCQMYRMSGAARAGCRGGTHTSIRPRCTSRS
jgi:hypothetical protein